MTLEELFTKEYESLKKEKEYLIKELRERDEAIESLRNDLDAETKYKESLERLILELEPRQETDGFIRVNTYISDSDDLYELLQKFVEPDREPSKEE